MKTTRTTQGQPVRKARVRLPRRRLFQGCAFLLLLPTAAAFLPVQGLAPQKPITLVPVAPVPIRLLSIPQKPVVQASTPAAARKSYHFPSLSGIASWYGNVLRGHRTASGERFDPNALTACHRSLPFGTLVRVVNLVNHRSVTVRITDRGVLTPNRVIDLSSAAAEQLDMLRAGVAPVRLEILSVLKRGIEQSQSAPVEPSPVAAER